MKDKIHYSFVLDICYKLFKTMLLPCADVLTQTHFVSML